MQQSIQTSPSVRRFSQGDLRDVLRIEKASFGVDAWPRDLFLDYAGLSPGLFLVAVSDGRVAGYSVTCVEKGEAEVASIAVLPRYRRSNIATALLRATISRVLRRGIGTIWLMVRRDNDSAIRLYKSFGFVRTATVRGYYEDGATAWRMNLSLSPSCKRALPARDK